MAKLSVIPPTYRFSTRVECTGCLRSFYSEDSGEVAKWVLRHQEQCRVIREHIKEQESTHAR